ncbi:MAG: HEAT repeat domain-containing protein [Myxococcales bacterium]|nr:HEAT repeat domain-containing protein [Myxococcales bacterium]
MLRGLIIGTLALLLATASPAPLGAQDVQKLEALLRDAKDFRVRVRAAFSLGEMRSDRAVAALALGSADRHPAVRAASVASLGRIGSASAMPALRRASRDRSAVVRAQAQRSIRSLRGSSERSAMLASREGIYGLEGGPRVDWSRIDRVITLGEMRVASGSGREDLREHLRATTLETLSSLPRTLVLARSTHLSPVLQKEIAKREITSIRLDGSITGCRARERSSRVTVRCEVSYMLFDAGERGLRGELRGAATSRQALSKGARSAQRGALARQALGGAIRSALTNADQGFQRVAAP